MTGMAAKHAWAFASGLAAVREARMLPAGFFRQLIAEPSPEGLMHRLTETPLHERVREPEDLRHADRHTAEHYGDRLDEMRQVSPDPRVVGLLALQRDFVSFKSFVKRRHMKLEVDDESASRYREETWERLWADLPTGLPGYFREAAERGRAALEAAPGRPEVLDAAVDSTCLSALCREAEQCGNEFVTGYFRRYDTAKGVEMLWRARALEADDAVCGLIAQGRHEGALFTALQREDEADWHDVLRPALEGLHVGVHADAGGRARARAFARAADEWLMAYARRAKSVAFGPERVLGYLIGLEAELHNLKVAVAGRANGVSAELLEGRLRACYV